jgi:hypothetical protein
MILSIDKPSILDSMDRLDPKEMEFTVDEARVIEGVDGTHYVFLEDYVSLVEAGKEDEFFSTYNLLPNEISFIVDEARIINNPHYMKSRKKYVKNSKVSVRPLNTKHTTKMLEDAIAFYEEYEDFTLFDKFINEADEAKEEEPSPGSRWVSALGQGIKKGAVEGAKEQIERVKKGIKGEIKKTALQGLALGGALYAGKKIAQKYAENDAKKPNYMRSELIKKLRVLRGKKAEYESKLERANREKWENRGILGKIVYKIKHAIAVIIDKLKGAAYRLTKT